jgi:hypothetical protein
LPTFGGPGDRDHQPLAQPLTSPLRRKHFFNFVEQCLDLRHRGRDQLRWHIPFVGEIDSCFDQRAGLDDLRPPVARAVAEQAPQLAQRLLALPIGVGMDQVVETLGLGEIEFSIFERAAGELARLGRPHILECRERCEQGRQHRAAAMDVKFRDVLAGRARRSGKPQYHRIVDRLPGGVAQQGPRRQPRLRHLARERGQRGTRLRPGDPHDRNRAWRPARRQGENRLLTWMHSLFASEPFEKAT